MVVKLISKTSSCIRVISNNIYLSRICYEQHLKKKISIKFRASNGSLNLNGLHLSVYPTFSSSKHTIAN